MRVNDGVQTVARDQMALTKELLHMHCKDAAALYCLVKNILMPGGQPSMVHGGSHAAPISVVY